MNPDKGYAKREESQTDWAKKNLLELSELYSKLRNEIINFQTFDLISNISYYNHLHSPDKYEDYRGDKYFFVPEALSLLCLKSEFVSKSAVDKKHFLQGLREIQDSILKYCSIKALFAIDRDPFNGSTISNAANVLLTEAAGIRNPGLPDHHLIFAEELFLPIKNDIKNIFGFTISDSIAIRKSIKKLINNKFDTAKKDLLEKAKSYSNEIIRFRKVKIVSPTSRFTKAELEEYSKKTDIQIRRFVKNYLFGEMYYYFSEIYCFTANEISTFAQVDLKCVNNFLDLFSCEFPSLSEQDEIYAPITILKTKPILHHQGKYLLPSIPLLTWAVEQVIEAKIRGKIGDKYSKIKHDYLLFEGRKYFQSLLPSANYYPPNLFYEIGASRYETDSIFLYDRVLFIVEAKGNRITSKAKEGNRLRTEDHLKSLVKDSYSQAMRTLEYMENNTLAEFQTKQGKRFIINRSEWDHVNIVILILEPIGNLSMLIKSTNEIGYFNDKYFPLIISLYDLVVIADLFENPIMLIHYINKRRQFLAFNSISTYDELDLIAYYLYNGLSNIDSMMNEVRNLGVDFIHLDTNSDKINDYYMYKFGHKLKFTSKPKCFIPNSFNNFLRQLDNSKIKGRVQVGLLLLEFNQKSINKLMEYVRKTKRSYNSRRVISDCSIFSKARGGIGITYMVGASKYDLDNHLEEYCSFKACQLNARVWIGLGDISVDQRSHDFKSIICKTKD